MSVSTLLPTYPGVYPALRKDGTPYYRASLTFKGKHISLGSFDDPELANRAYLMADQLLRGDKDPDGKSLQIHDYDSEETVLPFKKWVMLINLRDNGLYCNGPIYLRNKYFEYYLDPDTILRFGAEELFYYTHHTIQRRGGHLFVADYGLQTSILGRYGIRPFAVEGRDYYYKNGDAYDFRSGNIVILNKYAGVRRESYRGRQVFTARIHLNGDLVVGHYDNEEEAAIAYNKAADMLKGLGVDNQFRENYIEDMSSTEYKLIYKSVRLSGRFKKYCREAFSGL